MRAPEVIRMLATNVSLDGNVILNVSPNPQGLPQLQAEQTLEEVGNWLRINGESIYETDASEERVYDGMGRRRVGYRPITLQTFLARNTEVPRNQPPPANWIAARACSPKRAMRSRRRRSRSCRARPAAASTWR